MNFVTIYFYIFVFNAVNKRLFVYVCSFVCFGRSDKGEICVIKGRRGEVRRCSNGIDQPTYILLCLPESVTSGQVC